MTISHFDGSREQRFQEGYQTDYMVFQPGGGVTVMVTRRFGIRAHVDLQFAGSDLGSTGFGRIAVGGLVRLGG